ncbi:MAG TPA: helix-turn-helix transcriptional regulator, partial [Candidatus Angelobacter sp.]
MEEFSRYEIESAVGCLKNIMTRRGLSQPQLSDMSGISQSTISKMFSGESGATAQALKKLCRALGLKLEDILEGGRELIHDLCGYLGTPLTGLSPHMDAELQRTVDEIKSVAHGFSDPKIELYWPGDHTHPLRNADCSAQQVYLIDRSRASNHDFIVLFCGAPSYGVGQESEIATQAGMPAIRLTPKRMSRMMTGSFLHAIDVPFSGSLETTVRFESVELKAAFEGILPLYFKHRALYRKLKGESFGKRLTKLVHQRAGGYVGIADELGIALSYLHILMEENLVISNPSSQLLMRMAH